MKVVINPGSSVSDATDGWTNTYKQAKRNAQDWVDRLAERGFTDLELIETGEESDGRWRFYVRHQVTNTSVPLDIDGIDNPDAYALINYVAPRVYWNGWSADPSLVTLQDFRAEGFNEVVVRTFREEALP